ncbi:hypothetical protein Ahy_A04g017917 [Arachis hypogaea]|uniref:Aminotransferase-like plant mobile domain-containing protein n=1 Tax=Arachis hypogaea TaxID=3818 RepID=A0A445DCF2_ARAHY|nr:hypothetical protein Ahy_A04g017917 [Arachis hypogaea]
MHCRSRIFVFENSLITTFVEHWRPKTSTFHMSWGECTITLHDVAYHLGLCTNRESVGSCFYDFHTWYGTKAWELVQRLLRARPPPVQQQRTQRNESFSLKLTWLRDPVYQPSPINPIAVYQPSHRCLRRHVEGWTNPVPSSSSWCSAATIIHVHSSVLSSSVKLKADGDAEGSSTLHGTSILLPVPHLWSAFLALCSALVVLLELKVA